VDGNVTPDATRRGFISATIGTAHERDVAAHPEIRERFPVISEALLASASPPQVRNMDTMGGNLMQRARCGYLRDTAFACNTRVP
jgi:xanthine dehydrogenase YagS FAD-binding subunit